VLKWQKAEKKWTDGSFLELNATQIESDIIAFSKYIIQFYKNNSILKTKKLKNYLKFV
jgi:hypothetical protein